jgi:hypothetical protein
VLPGGGGGDRSKKVSVQGENIVEVHEREIEKENQRVSSRGSYTRGMVGMYVNYVYEERGVDGGGDM